MSSPPSTGCPNTHLPFAEEKHPDARDRSHAVRALRETARPCRTLSPGRSQPSSTHPIGRMAYDISRMMDAPIDVTTRPQRWLSKEGHPITPMTLTDHRWDIRS